MSVQHGPALNSRRSATVEFGAVIAILIGVYLWQRTIRVVTNPLLAGLDSLSAFGGLLVGGLLTGGVFIAGLAVFAEVYTTSREISVGTVLPADVDPTIIGLAGATPAALVVATKLVGTLTDVTYQSLTVTYYGSEGPLRTVLAVVGVELLVAVPSLVLICQVLVQGSLRRTLGGDRTVVVTTLVTGVLMTSNVGGLTTTPELGRLLGAVLFVLVLGIALYATENVEREGLRYLAYAPAVLFVAVTAFSGITQIESVAGGLFALTHFVALGIAAYTYERSESLFAPTLAYLSLLLANDAVVVVLESGL